MIIKEGTQIRTLTPVEAISSIWSSIYLQNRHHMSGTNEDQIKILMKDEWDRRQRYEFTTEELLDLWNGRKTAGKYHTRQQVTSAIQSLRAKNLVVSTSRGRSAKYSLIKVLEEMTAPESRKEIEISSNEKTIASVTNETTTIIDLLQKLDRQWKNHSDGTSAALNMTDNHLNEFTKSFNTLVESIKTFMEKTQDVTNHNAEANQTTYDTWSKFIEATNHNFKELESYFETLRPFLTQANGHSDYRQGYKDGFKDGRESYRDDLNATAIPNQIEKGQ